MEKLPCFLLCCGLATVVISIAAWISGPTLLQLVSSQGDGVQQLSWNSSYDSVSYMKIFFFNVTNTEGVISGEKPNLKEVGPFVYQGNITRIVDSKLNQPNILKYKDLEQYHFRKDLSSGTENDIITVLNVPFAGFAEQVSKLSSFSRIVVMGVLTRFNEGLFLTKTVKQLLFGGFHHELLATFSSITGEKYMPDNKFGFFYTRNNSNQGDFVVSKGIDNEESIGQIITWNKTAKLKWWDDDSCAKIDGSYDGSIFPPGIMKNKILTLFDPSMCRTFKYGFKREITFRGLLGYRFTILPTELQDPRTRPENMCYCSNPGENEKNCPKDGSYQMNACSKGASVSLSLPHFLHGSQEYLDQANGYYPNEILHEPYVDIEPKTGLVLQMAKRSQVNLHIRPLKLFKDFRKLHSMLFPSIWVEQSREIAPDILQEMTTSIQTLNFASLVGLTIGLALVLLSVAIFVVRCRKDKRKYNT